jgi:uncharacterized membrane protein
MDKIQKDMLFFGYGLALISAFFGVGSFIKHGMGLASVTLLVSSLFFIAVTSFKWEALKLGYSGWMKVAHLIGFIVTAVILTVVFFLVFTPVGILLRILRRDHMERSLDSKVKTYWYERSTAAFDKVRYTQQF